MTAIKTLNASLNGVELSFTDKPSSAILEALKEAGYRWHNVKKLWYAKQNEKTLTVAERLSGSQTETATTSKKDKAVTMSLYERVQFTPGTADTSKNYKFVGSNYTGLTVKDTAADIRKHLKTRFPEVKFSITSDYNSIDISIKSAPYQRLILAYDPDKSPREYRQYEADNNKEVNAIINYVELLTESYNYDDSDSMTDYFNTHFYKHINIDCDYIQTEQTEAIKADIKAFREATEAATIVAEEVTSGKYSDEDIKITREIHFTSEEAIEAFKINLLSDFDFIGGTGGSYTDDPRIISMEDFHRMISEERDTVKFYLQGAAVYLNGELQFVVDAQGYNYARYVGLTDEAMRGEIPAEAEKTPEILADIKTADIVESISAEVIEQNGLSDNWPGNTAYYKLMIEALKRDNINLTYEVIRQITIEELKIQLYSLYAWSPELTEQFTEATISEGEKVTLYYMSDMGGIIENRVIFDSFTACKYAQYDKAVKLVFTPEGKRKQYYNYFYGGKGLIIFKGWHNLPERVLWNVEEKPGIITRMSKFTSCDRTQFDEIINHFKSIGIQPIIQDKTRR